MRTFQTRGRPSTVTSPSATPLRQGIAWESQPRFSPDGKKILFTSDAGGGQLKNNVDLGNAFVDAHPDIACDTGPGPCECIPGDANGDGVRDSVELHYRVLEPSHLEFHVVDETGRRIRAAFMHLRGRIRKHLRQRLPPLRRRMS